MSKELYCDIQTFQFFLNYSQRHKASRILGTATMNPDTDLIDIIIRVIYTVFLIIGVLWEIKKIQKKKTEDNTEIKIEIIGDRNNVILLTPKQKPYNAKNNENITRDDEYNPELEA